MSRQPKDMTRPEFALWMMRELEVERVVEELRERYPDELLPDLRRRAADQVDALAGRLPTDVAGGYRIRSVPTPVFRAESDPKCIQLDIDKDDAARYGTYAPTSVVAKNATTAPRPEGEEGSTFVEPYFNIEKSKVRGAHFSLRWLFRGRSWLPFSLGVYRNDLFRSLLIATAWAGLTVRVPAGFHSRWRSCFAFEVDLE